MKLFVHNQDNHTKHNFPNEVCRNHEGKKNLSEEQSL